MFFGAPPPLDTNQVACKFFEQGFCKHESNCRFSHIQNPPTHGPAPDFMPGTHSVHQPEFDGRQRSLGFSHPWPCRMCGNVNSSRYDECIACGYPAPPEVASQTANQHQHAPASSKPPCSFYRNGHCEYGGKCRFSHVLHQSDLQKKEKELKKKAQHLKNLQRTQESELKKKEMELLKKETEVLEQKTEVQKQKKRATALKRKEKKLAKKEEELKQQESQVNEHHQKVADLQQKEKELSRKLHHEQRNRERDRKKLEEVFRSLERKQQESDEEKFPSLSDVCWFYRRKEKWVFFTPEQTKSLENAYRHGKSSLEGIIVLGKRCTCDIENMKRIDEETKFDTRIRRKVKNERQWLPTEEELLVKENSPTLVGKGNEIFEKLKLRNFKEVSDFTQKAQIGAVQYYVNSCMQIQQRKLNYKFLSPRSKSNEQLLFHATKPEVAIQIQNGAFVPSHSGMLGPGIYFAPSPQKAYGYIKGIVPCMLLCLVNTEGAKTRGSGGMIEHCVPRHDLVLPLYVLVFK